MFIGIGTDDKERTLDMAFRSIGTLASDVLRKAELRAARQATAANGKMGEAEAPPQLRQEREVNLDFTGSVEQPGGSAAASSYGTRKRPALSLDRCERIAGAAAPGATSPVAAMRSHLLSEWLRHAASG